MEGNTPTGVPAAMPDMQLCEHVHLMHTTTEDDKRAQCKEYITKLEEGDPISLISNLTTLLGTDMSADPAQNNKKMSLAIYLKSFGTKLTTQAEK